MRNKKLWHLVITFLVVGFLSACGTGANTNGSSAELKTQVPEKNEVMFQPLIETKEENNSVIVNYKVKNVSGESQKLTFSNGLKADFIVYDQKDNKVKQYSDEVSSTQAIEEVTLDNGEEIENGFTISDLNNGKYKIEVFLTAKEEQAKVVKDLTVEKSLYSEGSGTYIGQMDPHTIELEMNGVKEAFQLSEEAMLQITSLIDGENVSFIYKDDQIQKTIEKFILD